MFDVKGLNKIITQIAEEKGILPEQVVEAIESSIAAAYKKEYGERGEMVRAKLDLKTGSLNFWQVKTAVDLSMVRIVEEEGMAAGGEEPASAEATVGRPASAEATTGRLASAEATVGRPASAEAAVGRPASTEATVGRLTPVETLAGKEEVKLPRYNAERHIFLEEAKKIKSGVILGEELFFPLETHEDFGRIAAQAAKQVILQKLRGSERDSILKEWRGKEGQVVSGLVQRFERGHVYVDLGRTVGVMFSNESIPSEHYRPGERLKFLVLAVQEDTKMPGIILSRSHPKFVAKLFELEVPELSEGIVEIKAIAREPGNRTKLAVVSSAPGVDPVGALVGQRGTRVMVVNNELGNEKIDIIEWSDDPEKFVGNAISPAKARGVEILPRREARVFVPEDQLSLAIGRGGQNVRLAARLTGWKIDVRSQSRPEEIQEGGVAGTEGEKSEGAGDQPMESK